MNVPVPTAENPPAVVGAHGLAAPARLCAAGSGPPVLGPGLDEDLEERGNA